MYYNKIQILQTTSTNLQQSLIDLLRVEQARGLNKSHSGVVRSSSQKKTENKTIIQIPSIIKLPSLRRENTPSVPIRAQILTWSDFKQDVPQGTTYFAWTSWKTNYNYTITVRGQTVRLKMVSVKTELDKNKSWANPQKYSDSLLKHEQGHLDIAYVSGLEFKRRALKSAFTVGNYQNEIKDLYRDVMKEYAVMQRRYDLETCHFLKAEEQENWNTFIDNMILELHLYW